MHIVYFYAGSTIKVLGEFLTWNEAYDFWSKQPNREKCYMDTK